MFMQNDLMEQKPTNLAPKLIGFGHILRKPKPVHTFKILNTGDPIILHCWGILYNQKCKIHTNCMYQPFTGFLMLFFRYQT